MGGSLKFEVVMANAINNRFWQNLPFMMRFAIKTSIFKLPPLLYFRCLIKSI